MTGYMRFNWTSKRILIGKTDLDASYRRVQANAQIASTYIAIVGKISFLCPRLTFGTTPAPEEYTTTGEGAIDLGNDLIVDASWEETKLQSPHRHLLPIKDYIPASDLLFKSDQLKVNTEDKEASMDGFIDEIITITIDDPCWVERSKKSALLVIHTIFRPL